MTLPPQRSTAPDAVVNEVVRAPRPLMDRTGAVFIVSLFVRILLASVFLGSADTINSLTAVPFFATHTFFYLPYFPIVQSILGATSPLVSHAQFLPVGLTVKLVPCVVDSLLSVWLLHNNRFDVRYRRSSAWLYAFCPLPLIMICLQGQWDSLWILPAVSAVALLDLLTDATKARRTTLLLIGALLGLAVLSKPAAFVVAGLLLPSFRNRKTLLSWIQETSLVLTGAAVTVVLFFLQFAANGINVHQNVFGALAYGGQPQQTLFGLADLPIFRNLGSSSVGASLEFRQLAIIYVIAIVIYQLIARRPVDRMSAAAAVVLICPAIGGLAPDYLFWPLLFFLASGRLRIASVYTIISSCVCFVYFLIPGASYNPGVGIGALLPLRSLRFLGLPVAANRFFASSAVLGAWHLLANLLVPLAMCALGVYLLVSRRHTGSGPQAANIEPFAFRSLRTIVPYAVLMAAAAIGAGVVSVHDRSALVSSIYHGINRYSFANPIYTWHRWATFYFWMVNRPYRDILGGSWWGTFLILGPIGIAAWGAFAVRTSRRDVLLRRDE